MDGHHHCTRTAQWHKGSLGPLDITVLAQSFCRTVMSSKCASEGEEGVSPMEGQSWRLPHSQWLPEVNPEITQLSRTVKFTHNHTAVKTSTFIACLTITIIQWLVCAKVKRTSALLINGGASRWNTQMPTRGQSTGTSWDAYKSYSFGDLPLQFCSIKASQWLRKLSRCIYLQLLIILL